MAVPAILPRGGGTFHSNLFECGLQKRIDRLGATIAGASTSDRDAVFSCLTISNYKHIRNFLDLPLADLIPNLFLSRVNGDTQSGRTQPFLDRPCVVGVAVGDRENRSLNRGKPEWKSSSIVFDEECDEAFKAAKNRPVDDNRTVFGVVCPDILQLESPRELVVELDRGTTATSAQSRQ